ncbi:MAG: squalene/phytoene synthase family protein [Rhodospirillaceae bacterium]|nr:squalene/phytoene synthase family protein [Rhodospirillaceae bacterium]
MSSETLMPWLMETVRKQDRDRFIAAMLSPVQRREAVLAVLAFHGEIARIRDQVREPALGHIRLQWWCDALNRLDLVDDAGASPLLRRIAGLRRWPEIRPHLLNVIEARQKDLDDPPFADAAAAEAYIGATTAPLMAAMAVAGGFPDLAEEPCVRDAACGHGVVGLLRATPAAMQKGRQLWEIEGASGPAWLALVRDLADRADAAIASATRHRLPRQAFFLIAPAVLARPHLHRLRRSGYDIQDVRFSAPSRVTPAFLWHWWRGYA